MNDQKRYTITSALPYANGALHLGHLAGAYLPADIYVRYLRLLGKDVVWVCGSDEHGAAITIQAKKEGTTPEAIINKYHELNKETFEKLGISFDIYHRTSDPLHHKTAQDFFKKLYDQGGEFEEKTSDQYYDEEFNQFLADRYIKGTCPKCGHADAFGDQCENCGSTLSPSELVDPVSTLSGKKPTLRSTTHHYFKLDKHEEWLRGWIENGEVEGDKVHEAKDWKKHVVGQCLSWLDGGLHPRAITRDLDWGIKVPVEGADGKVLYVWFDAPIGYISATKQWAEDHGKNWEDYWKSEDSRLIHFIGKDNIVFHCIVFPAMLKAHGDFILPYNVPANQFLNFEGRKFSKSRGWGIEQNDYLETFKDFPNKEDALRYALIRNLPENKDADFKWDEFVEFHDNELVANLGNFINRVTTLTTKYYEGKIPVTSKLQLESVKELVTKLEAALDGFNFKVAIQLVNEISSYGNTYLQDVSPWKIYKEDPGSQEVKDCLATCLEIVALLSVFVAPFLPFSAAKIRGFINLPELANGDWETAQVKLKNGESLYPADHVIKEPELLFAKINDRKDSSRLDLINVQKEKLTMILEEEKANDREPIKPEVTFDDFTKMDLRTGTIIEAEKVKKADKLLKLTVDLGTEKRTVVSGIAKYYEAEKVIGQQVLLLVNLAPRKLRGIESQGMILMAENEKGALCFVSPEKGWGNGFVVK